MEANLDIDEDILREDYQTEEQARQGKEDLAAILRSMNDNMKMLGESMKRLHEPEPGMSGQGSTKGGVAESAPEKRQKLSKEGTPDPESGHCSDSEALLGAGKSADSKDKSAKDEFLENLSKSFEDKEETSEPVEDKLESIITKRWHQKLTEKQLKEKADKYTRPENCKTLVAPRVNKEIWAKLERKVRGEDLKISQPQKVLASAGSAIAQSTQLLLKARIENKAVDVEELIRMNADSLALLGHVSGDLAQLRRDNIRPHLSEDFYSLCSTQVPVTDYLFGNEDDLQTRITNITASNKISRATSNKRNKYQNQPGNKKPFNRDGNQSGKSFASQNFLGRGRQPPHRQKQWQELSLQTQTKPKGSANQQNQQWKTAPKY